MTASVAMHFLNAAPLRPEVIVSDYGSTDAETVRKAVEQAGGRVVRSETANEPWSRSAALNAGVFAASSDVIVTTDADIVFAPGLYLAALERLRKNDKALYLVQCRDLPPEYDVGFFARLANERRQISADALEGNATLRPRWGMGGFAAFSRRTFHWLNGYEERMKIWGAEDADFAKRFTQARLPLRWITGKDKSIFHMWHESSREKAGESLEWRVERNRQILASDNTVVRNLDSIKVIGEPLVSIVIPTHQRAELLHWALASCQAQTFSNFEVIVVENGGSECAAPIVDSFSDSRMRYFKIPQAGAAVARNFGNRQARGRYIAVMDDDDIMVSTRLEDHLRSLDNSRYHGSYSGWIDFNHDSWEVVGKHPGKNHSFAAMYANGRVIVHAGLMIEASVFQSFKYDDARAAGIDFALLFQLTFHGLCLNHTGKYGLLRRLHSTNMTFLQSDVQKESARLGVQAIVEHLTDKEKNELRKVGKSIGELTCSNENEALSELEQYSRGLIPAYPDIRYFAKPDRAPSRPLLDLDAYLERYPDVRLSGLSPAEHYRLIGRLLGREGPEIAEQPLLV